MRRFSLFTLAAVATLGYAQPALTPKPVESLTEPKVRLVPLSSSELVFDMIESADGTRLITHDRSRAPRLWEPRTMSLLRVLGGSTEQIFVVRFSQDGKSILTLSETEVRVWDAQTSILRASYASTKGAVFSSAAISADGKTVSVGTASGELRFYEVGNPLSFKEAKFPETSDVRAMVALKNGRFAAVTAFQGMIADSTGTVKLNFKGWEPPSRGLQVASDENSLLVTAGDTTEDSSFVRGTVLHLDATTGQVKHTFPHTYEFRMAAGSSNADISAQFVGTGETLIATFNEKGEIVLNDRVTGKPTKTLTGNQVPLNEIRVSPDRRRFGTYTHADGIKLFDIGQAAGGSIGDDFLNPTAATFSTDNKSFWIGYGDGMIRRFDIGKKSFDERKISATSPVADVNFVGDGWMQVTYSTELRGFSRKDAYRLWDITGGDAPIDLGDLKYNLNISPSGRILWPDFSERPTIYTLDASSKIAGSGPSTNGFSVAVEQLPEQVKQLWVGDGDRFVAARIGPNLAFGDVEAEGEGGNDVTVPNVAKEDDLTFRLKFFPDAQTALVSDYLVNGKEKWVRVNHRTGKVVTVLETDQFAMDTGVQISSDSKEVYITSWTTFMAFDAVTGKLLRETKFKNPDPNASTNVSDMILSPDEKTALCIEFGQIYVIDVATGKQLRAIPTYEYRKLKDRMFRNKPWVIATDINKVQVYDYLSGEKVSEFLATDIVSAVLLTPDQRRIVTADATDGVTFYDAEPGMIDGKPTHKRLANFVTVTDPELSPDDSRNLSWLAMDPSGRFDAADPNRVNSANFVVRWSGGLEPVGVEQLKNQFYEPGLMGKILGSNLESLRPVPSLESLKLYPVVRVTQSARKPNEYEVALTERDGGGIGRVRAFLNGKEIVTREGMGYFKIDINDFRQFMLPQSMLEMGTQKSNYLEVTATNAEGTLTSPTTLIDLGVPKDLQVPDVRVFALFAGTSDYVGTDSDLTAPSNDAKVLGKTIQTLATQLLPGKVNVTTLATSDPLPTNRPTRVNIMNWFDNVKAQATANDIIVVFFSGHGTSQIGEKTGYFYLTAEADPGDLTELSARTASVSGDDLRIALSQIPAKKQVVILDTCHSGAAQESLFAARSVPSDYQRAYESIRESTGTWVLAGSAADQLSYEAANVDHGMLTYSLLEAIDRATGDGMREAPGGELFLDVRTWLRYAAERVESLKNEVGLSAVQRPELKASPTNQSFDLGVLAKDNKGLVGLRPPKPILILGSFSQDEEDPINLEPLMQQEFSGAQLVKYWPEVSKHPNVHRVSGTYTVDGDQVTLKVFIQFLNGAMQRNTVATMNFSGPVKDLKKLAAQAREAAEKKVKELVTPDGSG